MNVYEKRRLPPDRPSVALWVVAAGLLVLGSPATEAMAQHGPSAQELRSAAEHLFPEPIRHSEAAELLCREARLRPADDSRGVEALVLCGRLYYYAREMRLSRRALEEASRRALVVGDVVRAANAMVDASLIARKQGDLRGVSNLAGGARLLARSPLLTSGQRIAIESRIDRAKPKETSS